MSITLEKINRRMYQLNFTSNSNRLKNLSGIRLLDESNNIFFENNALNLIKNWEGLDADIDKAFESSLEYYDIILKYGSKNLINKCTEILSEAASKVRNASELKRSLKYRLSRLNKGTTIKKGVENDSPLANIKNAMEKIKSSISSPIANNSNSSSSEEDSEDNDKLIEENYNILIEKISESAEIDRIVRQYSNIHKRFNIDKIISESGTDDKSIYNTIYNISKYIDTFNSPFKNKYNATLETVWYGLQKYHIVYENSNIINAVTDYYLFNNLIPDSISFIEDTKDLSKVSPIFSEQDFSCLDYIDKSNISTFFKSNLDYKSVVENYTLDGKLQDIVSGGPDEILSIKSSDKDEELGDFIKDFRQRCADSADQQVSNFITYKALVDQILVHQKSQLVFYIDSMITLLRVVFLSNDEIDIKDITKILDNITDSVLELPLSETQSRNILNLYDSELDAVKKLAEENNVARLITYSDDLEVDRNKVNNFITDNYSTEEENVEEDSSNSEDGLTEAAEIILIADLMTSLCEDGTIEPDISMIINGNVTKFTNDTIDALTDFSVTVPSMLDKQSLKETFIDYRSDLRAQKNKTIEDYIRIDCLTNNISRLNESTTIFTTTGDAKGCIAYLMCMNELKNLYIDEDSNKYFTEAMSFTNNLKLAANNLKRAAINLASKEKSASDAIDTAVNSIARNMEKEMSAQDRERVVRGSILPSTSKCIKLALTFAVAWAVQPAIAVIGALGMFFSRKNSQAKERQLALDEIEIELKMCERYLRMYEEQQDMQKIRQCEIIQRNLERQRQRIKYKMAVDFKHADVSSVKDPY